MEKTSRQSIEKNGDVKISVLIAASGLGARFGNEIPKQYLPLGDRAVLAHSIDKFLSVTQAENIRVIIHPDHMDYYNDAVQNYDLPPPVIGDINYRSISINNGLNSLSHVMDKDIIIIHDAARPLFDTKILQDAIQKTLEFGAATYAIPVTDTLRRENGNYVDRQALWTIQTPQLFQYGLLINAHNNMPKDDLARFTDDTSILNASGNSTLAFVKSSTDNIKITYDKDYDLARYLMEQTMSAATQNTTSIRSGLGYDVHAFDHVRSGPIRLGGIDIDHEKRLSGHSDADVVLHALTDAILGSIAQGDIGTHFPPSDNKWKNMDSAVFLEKAMELLEENNATLNNADITIICERPKIGPHVHSMRQKIAQICGVDINLISVKATTSERLGFTGREEGIACQAMVTIRIER